MRTALLLVALAALATATDFASWARAHGKTYTVAEARRREAIFARNSAEIEKLNAQDGSARFELNKFSDLTEAEFRAMQGFRAGDLHNLVGKVYPDDVDTTSDYANRLPGIKNQGNCGSCWAFSTVANAEAQMFKVNGGKVVSLSEQELVDCDKHCDSEGCYPYGCNGGTMSQADVWILNNNSAGLASEEDYPYTGFGSKCSAHKHVAKFSDAINWGNIDNDTTIIEYLDSNGPLSVCVSAGAIVFKNYKSGILDNNNRCGWHCDHAVTLVGYGTDSELGLKYWRIRNSWGPDWGEEGHVRISRGKNMCGINTMISTIIA